MPPSQEVGRGAVLKTDWTRSARHWVCGACQQKTFTPPAHGSRFPVPCRCGARDWTTVAGPGATLRRLNQRAKEGG